MNLRRRITVLLTIGLIFVLVVSVNAYYTLHQSGILNRQVIRGHLVLQKTQRAQVELAYLENALRADFQSANAYSESSYRHHARQLALDLNQLQTIMADRPDRQKRLRAASIRLREELADGIVVSESNPKPGILAGYGAGRTLRTSDWLRRLLKGVEASEKKSLLARKADTDQLITRTAIINSLGALMALVLIARAIYLLVKKLETSHQLNKKLQDSEQRVQQFLEAVPISVVVLDVDGNFYYANKAATELFGNTVAYFGTYASALTKIGLYRRSDGEPYPLAERPISRAMRGESARIDDMELRLEGRTVQIMTSASPVYDSENVLRYVISSTVDISDRAQSQLRLQEAKDMAEAAAQLKANFLANMSHEVRTPLNAMLGFATLLEDTPLNAEQREFTASIRTAGKNLLTIVNDILDISKMEAGMLQFEAIPFSVGSLVGSIQTMLRATAADKNLYLAVETDPMPPAVLGDPTRLTQILLNLISNSIKFTQEGGVTVSIRNAEQTEQSVRVRFVVADTGIGMTADVLPHIFERFRQATDFTTRFYGGTGLGLSIVKSLTEMQGGWITVDSTPGEGSCFTLELTYPIAAERVESAEPPTAALPTPNGRLPTVLVVEDNVMNQRLATQALKRLGYTARIAENGQQALDILQIGEPVDVVLMDIQMPVMDGYETTRLIRTRLRSRVPIIAMTAHALASEREQCLRAGMNDFVPKPFQMEDLQQVLQKYASVPVSSAVAGEPQPALPAASFSVASLMKAVDNDADFAAELLELFLEQTTGEIKTLQLSVNQQDKDEIGRIIHTQKVPAQMFGMTEAIRLTLALETLIASNGEMAAVGPLVHQYIAVLNVELPAIKNVLQTKFKRVGAAER